MSTRLSDGFRNALLAAVAAQLEGGEWTFYAVESAGGVRLAQGPAALVEKLPHRRRTVAYTFSLATA